MAQKQKSPLSLEQTGDTWYCAVRRLRTWVEAQKGSEEYLRPWLLAIFHQSTGAILFIEILEADPTPEMLQKKLFKTMLKPAKNTLPAHRPAEILFEDRKLAEGLGSLLQEVGVIARYQPQRKVMDKLVKSVQEEVFNDEEMVPGLLKQPGVKPELMGNLFEAALAFYSAQPWINLLNEDLLAIQVGSQPDPYYVSVMGNAGQEYGLSVFLNWQEVETFFNAINPEETIPPQGRHVFFFDPPPMVSFDDMDAIEKYGWKLPAPGIYPTPLIFTPDKVLRPKADMLHWYEAVLRALPVFVEKHLQTKPDGTHPPVEAAITVKTSAGEMTTHIRYPGGDLEQVANWKGLETFFEDEEDEVDELPALDRRALEGSLADLTRDLGGKSMVADPKVDEAQQVMYAAWDERNPAKRTSLARKALAISPDCADAYVLLAEEAQNRQQALKLFQEGVDAGRRALGAAFFEDAENIGKFWGILETRPYMRALEGLATTLLDLGRRDEAQKQLNELLRLNPMDNQGIRYLLLGLLFEMDRIDEAGVLLKEYEDDASADWAYGEALLAFRQNGRSPQAQAALKRALKINRHVPDYLTGKKRIPHEQPAYVTMGGEDEAIQYAGQYLNYWRKTPGAVAWLEKGA